MADETLWDLFKKNIKPIRKKSNTVIPDILNKDPNSKEPYLKKPINVVIQKKTFLGETPERWAHQHVQRLTTKEVKKKTIEGRIDLHGCTRAEAESALSRFFNWAQTSGVHFVLVITGKGGVLKELAPFWFDHHPEFVVSFNTAQPKDGGTGAFYVHVRRIRAQKN
ncbi:MAG: Smr/MutS family protein [Candidatus Paracaedibacteraceae bacterium]|nr:Smr/MutS family protein [Candidatus Paracaedibacteraceae bacterium]